MHARYVGDFTRVFYHPMFQRLVFYRNATLSHDFFKITVRHAISDVEEYSKEDHILGINKPAATKFFARVLEANGLPRKVVIDKSGANTAGIKVSHMIRKAQITPGICPFKQFAEMAT
ncbi:hypothetical protein SAMN05444358_11156 [Ruegeria halocynthiae]|uniref:DDE domain-containing protein n=1 Tax=Ruegeria halocynthiae TaxID=985054 RepID=A0A1H3EG65_9RHOB|nr:hypothetical protein SAMN05444358_11156 [Ruegeria halocynthiae]